MQTTLHPNVTAFLSRPLPHYIGGREVPGPTGDVINPSDGSTLARVSLGGAAEIDLAVTAAAQAFPAWAALRPNERAVALHRLADALERHTTELAQLESLDVGKPITAATSFDVPFGIQALRYFADLAVQAHYRVPLAIPNIEAATCRQPYGVCGFIFPWNFPFTLLCWGIAPALAAGNTVVVKPSEVTPLTSLFVAQLAAEAGLPSGVINVVTGTGAQAGAALAAHPRIKRMSFTGSPAVGRQVGAVCGQNLVPCKLELGGKGAAVVFDDANVPDTARKLAAAITLNTGQVCCTATRWMIHERIYDAFVDAVRAALRETHIGPGLDTDSQMGPLVSEVQRQRVLGYLDRGRSEGAAVLLEGGPCQLPGHRGFYVTPALLAGAEDNVCCREEIFGPCAYLVKFTDEDKVIRQVNQLAYGLANSVWSADLHRANRVAERLVAGNSWINAHNVFAYGLPYGGVNLSGLGGGVNSPETFNDYLRSQTIARPLT